MLKTFVVFVYLLLPSLVLLLCNKFQFLNRVGAVVLSYVFGLVLGVLGLSNEYFADLQDVLMSTMVPLAIPLLLFSSNVRAWSKLGFQPIYSLFFAIVAVFIAVLSGYLLFGGNEIDQFNKIGGLLVGIYSGGTPNLASLKMILEVDEDIYLAVHSYDMAIGAVYLFFLMGLGRRVFQFILPKFDSGIQDFGKEDVSKSLFDVLKNGATRMRLMRIFLVAILIVVVSGLIMMLLPKSIQMVVFIFLITALGIWGSSIKKINSAEGSFDLGMYLILVFSVLVSSKVQIDSLSNVNPTIFAYITFVVFISLFLHVLFARFRKIDADTVIITSTALICSPPFVPVVAGALKNRSLIVPGLTIGLIGYAVGNYLGYFMALLLAQI